MSTNRYINNHITLIFLIKVIIKNLDSECDQSIKGSTSVSSWVEASSLWRAIFYSHYPIQSAQFLLKLFCSSEECRYWRDS